MNMRKKFVTTAAALAIAASTVLTGAAQTVIDTSSVTVGAGAFTVSFTASDFVDLPYSLSDQFARGGNISILVNDQTGDSGGWTVTLSITDFVGQTRPGVTDIPSENLVIVTESVSITTALDDSQAVSLPNMTPVTSETAPQLTWTANPGYGAGAYNLNMSADLEVPGRTQAQKYTATGTLNVVAGP